MHNSLFSAMAISILFFFSGVYLGINWGRSDSMAYGYGIEIAKHTRGQQCPHE